MQHFKKWHYLSLYTRHILAHLIEMIVIEERHAVLQFALHGIVHLTLPFLFQFCHTLIHWNLKQCENECKIKTRAIYKFWNFSHNNFLKFRSLCKLHYISRNKIISSSYKRNVGILAFLTCSCLSMALSFLKVSPIILHNKSYSSACSSWYWKFIRDCSASTKFKCLITHDTTISSITSGWITSLWLQ